MQRELAIFDHQEVIAVSSELLERLTRFGQSAWSEALAVAHHRDSALSNLSEVEVSLVDDETIADVHMRFMDIPGATDVITFNHGEIHISVETARSQAEEYQHDFERELALYVIHGLLHLAGHEDASELGASTMAEHQERILSMLW
ncbi:MAG: rRNA maturation RNase YbeY [Akkermansiaceae bacterium]